MPIVRARRLATRHRSERGHVVIVASMLAACASHEGWSAGRQVVLRSLDTLELRRSEIDHDEATGELVMHWVGARATDGAPDVAACEFTVFADRNGNGIAEPDEVLAHRASDTRGRKIQFDDVRVKLDERQGSLTAMLVARAGGEERSRHWPFAPDD